MPKRPTRALLITAGVLNQLFGVCCLVLALASLPIVHDLHRGMQSVIASVIASIAAIVCGTLLWRGRLVPLALAVGIDIGFGIVLPRGSSALSALVRILPADDVGTAEGMVTAGAIAMFATAVVCVLSIPSALALRRWALAEIQSGRASDSRVSGSTLRGLAPVRFSPTEVVRMPKRSPSSRAIVIAGVALTVAAVGIVVIAAVTGPSASPAGPQGSGSGHPASGSEDAGSRVAAADARAPVVVEIAGDAAAPGDAPGAAPPIEELVAKLDGALGKPKDLAALIAPKAFAFGVEAHEVAEGRDAIVKMLAHDVGDGKDASSRFTQVGHEGDLGWFAEEVMVGGRTFVVTGVAELQGGAWAIAALHWASALPNEAAYRTARDGSLAVPDAIPDSHDESELATAMRTAFASKPSFVAARSARPDAFNFGSAPGERIVGGDAIKKTFARIKATIHLHDAVKVGALGDRGGWGAANVDFTDADPSDGTQVTQTFRVLAAWLKEPDGWRIVQTQWSNPK